MKNFFLAVLFTASFLFAPGFLSAQQTKVDSLLNVLKFVQFVQEDTSKVEIWCALCKENFSSNSLKAIEYGKKGIALAEKSNNKKIASICYNYTGSAYFLLGEFNNAREMLSTAISVNKEKNDQKGLADNYNTLGSIALKTSAYVEAQNYFTQALGIAGDAGDPKMIAKYQSNMGAILQLTGNFKEAETYLFNALETNKKISNKQGVGEVLNNLGTLAHRTDNYEKAIDFYLQSLKIKEELNDKRGMAKTLNNIGTINSQIKNYDLAIQYLERSLLLKKELSDKPGVGESYNNLGSAYSNKLEYDKALPYFKDALKIHKELDRKELIAGTFKNMAQIYEQKKDFYQAIELLEQSLKIREEIKDVKGIASSSQALARIYKKLNKNNEAITIAEQAIITAKNIGANENERGSYLVLAQAHFDNKNFKEAYLNLEKHLSLKDSLLNENIHGKISELETKYETEKKEAQIKSLHQEKAIQQLALNKKQFQNYAYMSGAALLLVISGLLFWLFKLKQKTNKQLQLANVNLEEKNIEIKYQQEKSELKALLAQMNPHFIFNALNSIQGYIATNEKEKANVYLTTFGKLVRAILDNSNKSYIAIKEELEALEMYTRLEGERAEDKFKFVTDIDPAIDIHNLQIPPMLIQPHIENAIWHGIMPANGKGVITLAMKLMENKIHCTIEDNGIGIKQAFELKKLNPVANGRKSNGVEITRQRLEAIWQKKQQQHTINIADRKEMEEQNGTRVEFFMPYEF